MGLKKDLPLLLGLAVMLTGLVFAGGNSGLPGIGDFDNPLNDVIPTDSDTDPEEEEVYDIEAAITLDTTFAGETSLKGFTYQTPESGWSLSIANTGDLSLGGADAVRVTTTLENKDTGRILVENTKRYGEVPASETVTVETQATNVEAGNYEIEYTVSYNPKYYDVTDWDNEFTETYDIMVPKVRN